MIRVNEDILIVESEITFTAVRSSGPGGQHANKVSTAIVLQYDINSSTLTEEVKNKLSVYKDQRISADGMITIKSDVHRSQSKNKQEVVERLIELIQKGTKVKKKRKPTRPTSASVRKRVEDKKKRGAVKAKRKKIDHCE